MIKLIDVCKTYGSKESKVEALKNINLCLEEGKFIVIVGKSGSGKTTLMNMIGALDQPTSGCIFYNEKEVTSLKPNELALYRNKTIGFVFQNFYLEPTYTVLENVCMPLTIAGEDKKIREGKGIEILKKLGLGSKIKKKANELSGGEKQRVSIARALISNPSIILADEPTGNLDSENGREIMRILKTIVTTGKTVILVTHNMDDAKNADIIITIKDGRIISKEEIS